MGLVFDLLLSLFKTQLMHFLLSSIDQCHPGSSGKVFRPAFYLADQSSYGRVLLAMNLVVGGCGCKISEHWSVEKATIWRKTVSVSCS